MRPGRKPKPAALKLLAGNPGKRQVPETVEYPAEWPEMPDFLDDLGRKEWARACEALAAVKVVAKVDGSLLAGYCDAVSCAVRASEKARLDASWNPERRASWTLARMLGALFGFGPAERVRVKGTDGKAQDTKARFFA